MRRKRLEFRVTNKNMAKTVKHIDLKSFFGSEDHLELAQTRTFSSLIYETLTEKTPTEAELKVFELILNLSIDHGTDTPSAKVVIEEAQTGETISEAVAEGIEEINDTHGGAAEPLMKSLYEIRNTNIEIRKYIEEKIAKGEKLAGFGHRIYKNEDPRAQLILKTLTNNGFPDDFINIAEELRQEFDTQAGKLLPLNIDGAIAVALCTLGLDPKLGKAVFICARIPGLCAHYLNNAK